MSDAPDAEPPAEEESESDPPPPPLIDPALVARIVAAWEDQGCPMVIIARNERGQAYSTTTELERFLVHPGACCEADRYAAIREVMGQTGGGAG